LIDGFMVIGSISGYHEVFLVKGYRHPEGRIVVIPYAYKGTRFTAYPGLDVTRLDCIGWPVPQLAKNRIVRVLDPFTSYRLRYREIPVLLRELINLLGVDDETGLTGSYLLFKEGRSSDVDFLIAAPTKSGYILNTLRELRDDGYISQCRPWATIRSKVHQDWLRHHYETRVLESCYKGVPYTIRLLRATDPMPCTGNAYGIGYYNGMVRLRGIGESHLVPSRYEIVEMRPEPFTWQGRRVLEVWRTRYQELKEGWYSLYNARLTITGEELVISVDPQGRMHPAVPRGADGRF